MIKEAKILLVDNVHNNLIDKFDLLSDFDPAENNAPQNFNFYPSIFKILALFSLALIKLLPKTKSENLMQDLRKFFPKWYANARTFLCNIIKGGQYVYSTGR